MAKFSFFSFEWLTSKERQKQKEETVIRLAEIERRSNKADEAKELQEEFKEQVLKAPMKPFKSCRLVGRTAIVVLHDGTNLSKNSPELIGKVRQAQSEEEIIELFTIEEASKAIEIEEQPWEKELIRDNRKILLENEDFVVNEGETFLKNIPLPIPSVVLASFIELCERINHLEFMEGFLNEGEVIEGLDELYEKYEALKAFWAWTALNPIDSSRRDLLKFVRKNNITITSNGLLVMYRRVVRKKEENHELIQFVSNQYNKIKKWKKSPKNYEVFDDGGLVLQEVGTNNGTNSWKGNLEELYLDLPNMQGGTYTDAHTGKKDIRVGQVYREDEDKIDLDNTRACSKGLHTGAESFGFDGFGDVGVITLVNPMYVRSVPTIETNKMRVSEMFIAAIAELDEYKELVNSSDVVDYSNIYCSQNIQELEEMIKEKKIDKLVCQENFPAIAIPDIINIKDMLKGRVVNIK